MGSDTLETMGHSDEKSIVEVSLSNVRFKSHHTHFTLTGTSTSELQVPCANIRCWFE